MRILDTSTAISATITLVLHNGSYDEDHTTKKMQWLRMVYEKRKRRVSFSFLSLKTFFSIWHHRPGHRVGSI